MQDYSPSPMHTAHVSDNKVQPMRTSPRGQQQPPSHEAPMACASGVALPPHMAQAHAGYAQYRPRQQQDQALSSSTAAPLPPHLQRVHGATPASTAVATAAARPNGMPDHLQPRPFRQQRDTSPPSARQQQQKQAQDLQQRPTHMLQPQQQVPHQPQQQQQQLPNQAHQQLPKQQPQMAKYPPGLGSPEAMRSEPVNAQEQTRMVQGAGLGQSYQQQIPYGADVGGGDSGGVLQSSAASAPGLEPLPGSAVQAAQASGAQAAGWYQGGLAQPAQAQAPSGASKQHQPAYHHQQQQQPRLYEGDLKQQGPGSGYATAPAGPEQAQQRSQPQQLQQQQYAPPPSQQQQYPQQRQQPQHQQQYAPPTLHQHEQQYQQQPYQQQQHQPHQNPRPVPVAGDTGMQAPRGLQQALPQASTQAEGVANSGPSLQQAAAAPAVGSEPLKFPPPPVPLKPAAADVAPTPASFVQLLPQPATIQVQIDQSGVYRVVPPLEGGAGPGPGQPMTQPQQQHMQQQHQPQQQCPPSQQPEQLQQPEQQHQQQQQQTAYGSAPAQQHPQQQHLELQAPPLHLQQHQAQRYGGIGEPPPPSVQQAPPQIAQGATQLRMYDIPPFQQQPVSAAGGGSGVNAGPGSWDNSPQHHVVAAFSPSCMDSGIGGGGDGRTYMHASEPRRPYSPPPVSAPQDGGYSYDEPLPRHLTGSGRSGNNAPGDRRGSHGPPPELGAVSPDGYGGGATPSRHGHRASAGLQGDAGYANTSAADTGRDGCPPPQGHVPPVMPPAAAEPESVPPLPEAIKLAEAAIISVAAARVDGELMAPHLPKACEKRLLELSRAIPVAEADAAAARAAAEAAATAVMKAEADAAAAVEADAAEDMKSLRPGQYAFLMERSIRTVWPLSAPEHQLYRAAAEALLLEWDCNRVASVNTEVVRLRPHEMVGAMLCNVPSVRERVPDVKAAIGSSITAMALLRQESAYFEVTDHLHKQDLHKNKQGLVRLRVSKLPSFNEIRRVLRAAIDTLLPAPEATTKAAASTASASKSKAEPRSRGISPVRGRTCSFNGREMSEDRTAGGGDGGSLKLQFLGREPEGLGERLVLRHVGLHLLSCKSREIGLFTDRLEAVAEALPPRLARLYGKSRLPQLKELLLSHPFFWVAPKTVYGSDGLNSQAHDCVALHSNTMLEFQYRARLVLQQQQVHPPKRRRTGTGTAEGSGGSGGDIDGGRALEEWWADERNRRPRPRAD